jgi:hypothetical protein
VRTQLLDDRIKDSNLSTYLPSHTSILGILSCCLDQRMFPVVVPRCYLCFLCHDFMYLYSERWISWHSGVSVRSDPLICGLQQSFQNVFNIYL